MDDWTELTDGPILGRSMQPAHIFFQGDAGLAQQRLGVARKILGYTEFDQRIGQLGFTAKVVTLADGTVIRAICHGTQRTLLINVRAVGAEEAVVPPAHGYQFYTTTMELLGKTWLGGEITDFWPGGSVVYVPTPEWDSTSNADPKTVPIYARAKGTVAKDDRPPLDDQGRLLWPYYEMPDTLPELSEIMTTLLPVGIWQVNGIPEHVYYKCNEPGVITAAIVDPWLQADIPNAYGLKHVLDSQEVCDVYYDVAPTPILPWENPGFTSANGKAPDSDWMDRATLLTASHVTYGSRVFIILADAAGVWHCYPLRAPIDESAYIDVKTLFSEQGYKANIAAEYVKSSAVSYPEWVWKQVDFRNVELNESALEPRYSWSFDSTGTHAISIMLERKKTAGIFREIDYTHEYLGTALYYATNILPEEHQPLQSPFLPTEVARDELMVDAPSRLGLESKPDSIMMDRMGYVELEFTVSLTGPGLKDFNFDVGVHRSASPDELAVLSKGTLVEVAYAKPLRWDTATANQLGWTLTNRPIPEILVDTVLCVWAKAYRHEDQTAVLDAFDGEVALPVFSKAFASFERGYPERSELLFAIPLEQTDGPGYTYFEVEEEGVLPPEPHKYVKNTSQMIGSQYPWIPGFGDGAHEYDPVTYWYSTKISHLDLGSLSFYCHARVVAQQADRVPVIYPGSNASGYTSYEWSPVKTKARSWCAVCVMGRVVDQAEAGHATIPTEWLKGWIHFAGTVAVSAEEALVDPLEVRPFRGIGAAEDQYGCRGGVIYDYSHLAKETKYIKKNPLGESSWIYAGNYYTYINQDINGVHNYAGHSLGVAPWWLTGACGEVVNMALFASYVVSYFGGAATTSYQMTDAYGNIVNTGTQTFYGVSQLWSNLTQETAVDFLIYVYNFFDDFTQEAFHTQVDPPTGHITSWTDSYSPGACVIRNPFGVSEFSYLTVYAENPFAVACPQINGQIITASLFATAAAGYFWELVKYWKRIIETNNLNYLNLMQCTDPYLTDSFGAKYAPAIGCYFLRPPLHTRVYPRGGGSVLSNYHRVIIPDVYDLFRKSFIIRNFEYGTLAYTHLLHTHFNPVWHKEPSQILITPEGHLSYAKWDCFEFTKEVYTFTIFYAERWGRAEPWNEEGTLPLPNPPVNTTLTRTNYSVPWQCYSESDYQQLQEFDITQDIEWAPIDGVSWFYGKIKSNHRSLYSLAYHGGSKKYLLSEEEFSSAAYQTADLPYFTATPTGSHYCINPRMNLRDHLDSFWEYLTLPWGQVPFYIPEGNDSALIPHEYRDYLHYIRLSPLFF